MRRAVVTSLIVMTAGLASCVFKTRETPGGGGEGGQGGDWTGPVGSGGFMRPSGGGGAPPPAACRNLQCQQTTCIEGDCKAPACPAGQTTRVSGTIYDPAGKVPLYNVAVYVPNAALAPIPDTGATCAPCNALSGEPLEGVGVLTDARGRFTMNNVPVGNDIPMVIQVGKWRREVKIPTVKACEDNMLDDRNLTRLPRNQTEGNIPKIALTTGGADALECLLRKIGLEDSEFTPESGPGRVNLFAGGNRMGMPMTTSSAGTNSYAMTLNGGAAFTDAEVWWESLDNLRKYDIVLHSCEGVANPANKSAAAKQALLDYMNMGGRVFASHWHNNWIEKGPAPLPSTATFRHLNDPPSPFTATIDTTFAKGQALAEWLMNVGGSTTMGQLVIVGAKQTVQTANTMMSQRWIYSEAMMSGSRSIPASTQYYSFNTPIGVEASQQCGKTVFSDLHVSAGAGGANEDDSTPTKPFPTGCITTDLSPQEKALEFMLFDLSACVMEIVP